MNINFTPAVRKTVLGGVAALALAGGALSLTNSNKADKEANATPIEITHEDVDNYYKALSNLHKAYLDARHAEVTDSINYSNDSTTENHDKYLASQDRANNHKILLEAIKKCSPKSLVDCQQNSERVEEILSLIK